MQWELIEPRGSLGLFLVRRRGAEWVIADGKLKGFVNAGDTDAEFLSITGIANPTATVPKIWPTYLDINMEYFLI